jgi:protein-disulfide isomerase
MVGRCVKVVADEAEKLRALGVGGVPATFINGRFIGGAQPIDEFKSLIDEELRKARQRTRNRPARARRYYRDWVEKRGIKETPLEPPRTVRPPPPPPRPRMPPPRRPDPSVTYAVPIAGSPFRGSKHAKITVVMACQFSGPYCNKIRPVIDQLFNTYGNDMKLVVKHFPVHQRATLPALAACAAHRQGRYWDMDAQLWGPIFAQADWSRERMRQAARELGLDMSQFDADVDGACPSEVRAETAEMRRVGVTGTPTVYINGRHVSGARPFPSFSQVVDEELAKANKRIKRRGDVKRYYVKWVIALGVQEFQP